MPKGPHFLLDLKVGDLHDWWLEMRCCRGTTYLPLKWLASRRPPDFRLRDALRQLRCRTCGKAPGRLAMVESPTDGAPGRAGAPGGWRLELVLPEGKQAIQR